MLPGSARNEQCGHEIFRNTANCNHFLYQEFAPSHGEIAAPLALTYANNINKLAHKIFSVSKIWPICKAARTAALTINRYCQAWHESCLFISAWSSQTRLVMMQLPPDLEYQAGPGDFCSGGGGGVDPPRFGSFKSFALGCVEQLRERTADMPLSE
jgi:hypothetical protein